MKHFQGLQHEIFSSTLSSCCRDWAAGMLLRANLQLLADLLHLFTIKSAYISFFLLLSCRSNPPYPPPFFFWSYFHVSTPVLLAPIQESTKPRIPSRSQSSRDQIPQLRLSQTRVGRKEAANTAKTTSRCI